MLSAVFSGDDIWVVSLEEALKENNEVATVEANANVVQVGGWVRRRECVHTIFVEWRVIFLTCVFICATWSVCMYTWHGSCICMAWLLHKCHAWHDCHSHEKRGSYTFVWHHSLIRVPWRIHARGSVHLHVCHGSFVRVTWFICRCDSRSSILACPYPFCNMFLSFLRLIHGVRDICIFRVCDIFTCDTCDLTCIVEPVWHDPVMAQAQFIHTCNTTHLCVIPQDS